MRDIFLVLAFLPAIPVCFLYPGAGVVLWSWVSIMNPHKQVWGFAAGQQFNLVIALATIVGWLLSTRERKRWTPDWMPWLMLAFVVWMTLSTVQAPFQQWSWGYWDRTMRTLAVVFLTFFLINTKARMHALVWAIVIALGYYGVKGGIYTIRTGGTGTVYGPPGSIIEDNNQLALAIVMSLPLLNYLRMHTRQAWMRLGLIVAMGLHIVMIFGSRSRGGMLALGVMLGLMWLRSKNKLVSGVVMVAVVGVVLWFMPDKFWERLDTLNNIQADGSFTGRVTAWKVATLVAIDRFPFGAGFYAPQLKAIYNSYFPGAENHAAHSIYFQVLGEQGFVGLGIYVFILLLALWNLTRVMRRVRGRPGMRWAYDMADMIRLALIGFCFGGAALSMAYFDGFLLLVALGSVLLELTAPARRPRIAPLEGLPAGPPAYGGRLGAPSPANSRAQALNIRS